MKKKLVDKFKIAGRTFAVWSTPDETYQVFEYLKYSREWVELPHEPSESLDHCCFWILNSLAGRD